MSGSTLTAFAYIAEDSDATPGLFNRIFSQLSDNIGTVNNVVLNPSVLSGSTWASIGLQANSSNSDYIRFLDSSGQRSTYRLGSAAGGTADGLNLWDESGNTMIATFSKQSVRFYQNIVGPVFDTGGALSDTLNAATFGTAADSDESRIQAAIDDAANRSIKRVYVPASMLPYSASSVSFIWTVQMTREGGDSSVYDIQAYGASPTGASAPDAAPALRAAINSAGQAGGTGGGYVLIPPAILGYRLESAITSGYEDQIIDFQGTTLFVSHNSVGLTLGKTTGTTKRLKLLGGYIRHFENYNWVDGSIGVRVLNCQYGQFHFSANGFYNNVQFLGNGAACEFNYTNIGVWSNALFGLKVYGDNSGYCNDNTFDAGTIRFDSGTPSSASTGYCIHIDRSATANGTVNNNRFRGVGLESARTIFLPRAIYLNGQQCHFSQMRGEGGFAAKMIELGSDATIGTNYFQEMGPNFVDVTTDIDFTLASGASYHWIGNNSVEHSKRLDVKSRMSVAGEAAFSQQVSMWSILNYGDSHLSGEVRITGSDSAVAALTVTGPNATARGQIAMDSTTGEIPRMTWRQEGTFRMALQANATDMTFDAQNNQTYTFGGTGQIITSASTIRLAEAATGGGLAGTAAGTAGDIAWGSSSGVSYLYVCVSTNSWMRATLNPF